jgi:hypothetical protein
MAFESSSHSGHCSGPRREETEARADFGAQSALE